METVDIISSLGWSIWCLPAEAPQIPYRRAFVAGPSKHPVRPLTISRHLGLELPSPGDTTIEVVFSHLQRLAFKSGDDPRQVRCLSQTAEAGLRHGSSRLQEAHVPDASAATVSPNLRLMAGKDG